MPVPSDLSELSIDPSENFPVGTESVFPNLDNYLRAHAAFLAQLNARWPVGSIYLNASSSANPESFLPGAWVKITDGVLYAHGAPDAGGLGTKGGASTVKLTTSQMPSHGHSISSSGSHSHSGTTGSGGSHSHTYTQAKHGYYAQGSSNGRSATFGESANTGSAGNHSHSVSLSGGSHTHTANNTGGGAAHENKMPFLTVYMWRRVS